MCFNIIGASTREKLTLMLANNKGADQPVHSCSLISTFVIHYLKHRVAGSDMSISSFSFFVGFNVIKPLATPLILFAFYS